MQTTRAIVSLILRVTLLGLAVPVLLGDFPGYMAPSRIMTDWATLAALDTMAVLAPLARWRKFALLAGLAAVGAHYYLRHEMPVWDMGYLLLAIVFVLLPPSGRVPPGKLRPSLAPGSRISKSRISMR
jgi:hypothetical protein